MRSAGDNALGGAETKPVSKYGRLIAAARSGAPALTIVAHPCDSTTLQDALEARDEGLIEPVLVGSQAEMGAEAAARLIAASPGGRQHARRSPVP
jgi:hypothetical protein